MKKLFSVLAILLLSVQLMAQMPSSVDEVIQWHFSVDYQSANEATLIMTVNQKDGWHVYAQNQPEGSVGMPTSFTFEPSSTYELLGKTKEYGTELHEGQFPERIFPGNKAVFKQKIKILSPKDFNLNLSYTYMACKESCFPPTDGTYSFKVKGATEETNTSTEGEEENLIVEEYALMMESGMDTALLKVSNSCQGFKSYIERENFKPVTVEALTPKIKADKNFLLEVRIEVDSIFAMYDFDNEKNYQSLFKIRNSDNITLIGEPNISIKSDGVLYHPVDGKGNMVLNYSQEVKVNQPTDTLWAYMDIYLAGCEYNFVNKEPFELSFDLSQPMVQVVEEGSDSLWGIFLLAFASGLIALLTPCVFPMIPMTVTFFTKQSKTKSEGFKKATLYALFIIVIYVLLGVVISAIFGASALNEMATNPWVNLIFAILFIVFAISFLGAFEINLPTSWVNKADQQADKGGLIGIFFMAFTLALVSFSCTGPIVGAVLVKSAEEGQIIAPIVAMLGFSTALALPFGLFAAFPGWLNSLPQSGGWLNTVKVVLGLVEMAFALKFLVQADQGFETFMLKREIFLALWVAIFILLSVYLFGLIEFPHDSKVEKLSVGRGLLGMLTLAFAIYLLPGLWGAPVHIISGIVPSKSQAESPYGVNIEAPDKATDLPQTAEYHGHGIWVIKDYNDALEYAKKVNKPLLIDFTGIQCVNCRKMEDFVWANEEVAPIMADKFVIASLFIDDKAKLPENEWVTLEDGTILDEVGKKWFHFQVSKYEEGTQPLYVVVDHQENNISGKANYETHREVEAFKNWLNNALNEFDKSTNPEISKPDYKVIK